MRKSVIGFVGLGLMGAGFTRRLTATGHRVIGYDIDASRMAAAAGWGVEAARSAGDVALRADHILTCVMTKDDLASVVLGPDGVVHAGPQRGKVLVDHSTMPIATVQSIAAELQQAADIALVDAPVSGGPGAAESGTLAIMAGGSDAAIAAVAPVMASLGQFTHMGPLGAGQATKLVNQALVLTNYCVIAEAFALAETLGIDTAKVPAALASGHAGSNLLPILFERMAARDFTPRGYARQVEKDLAMLGEAAGAEHLPLPMSGQALTLFRALVRQGHGDLDGAAVLRFWRNDQEKKKS